MSQYPSPYTPPPGPYPLGYYPYGYGGDPYAGYLGPARRAGWLMIIMGSLGLLCGLCAVVAGPTVPWHTLPPENMGRIRMMEKEAGMPIQQLLLIGGIVMATPSVLLVVFGIFVRHGGKGAVYSSMVLVGLMLALMVVQIIGLQTVVDLCMWSVMTGLFVLAMVWLAQAAKGASAMQMAREQYQAQYWQYMQQQQQYGQAYGGTPGYAPPPPPESPPLPPAPPPPPPEGGV